uniref:Uncharacterized protein n=1 Tax=Pelusios castaneus TaxID=367368 RepID=A0A8C8RTB6_9SAUR
MSVLCPPSSPAVAKTESSLNEDSPILAAIFAYWDNSFVLPKTEQMLLGDGEITFLANHTVNGEILRNAQSGAIDVKCFVLAEKGVIIMSLIFDGNWNGHRSTYGPSIILLEMCVDRLMHVTRKGRIWMHKERQEHFQKVVLKSMKRMQDQIRGQCTISMLAREFIPVMELLSSMKTHSIPEEIDVKFLCCCILIRKRLWHSYLVLPLIK